MVAATLALLLYSAAAAAAPSVRRDKCGTATCREFPVSWWVWGLNDTNLTAPWSMQPLTKTQLGGHCSALTPVSKRPSWKYKNLSDWSEGVWPRTLPQNNTEEQLAAHIATLEAQLPHCVPDPEFDGNAVFDYEEWDPVWEMNNCTYMGKAIYPAAFEPGNCTWRGKIQQDSIDLVRAEHPDWNETQLVAQAKHEFQTAAALFMVKTMETVKRIRPKATWGFYMFPYKQHGPCDRTPSGKFVCGYDDGSWGKRVSDLYTAPWLLPAWRSVDAIFPSIYLSKDIEADLQTAYVKENVDLSLKIAKIAAVDGQRKKVLPFGTLYYHGMFGPTAVSAASPAVSAVAAPPPPSSLRAACMASLKALNESTRLETLWTGQEQAGLMNDFDVNVQFEASLAAGADGLILWGGGSQPYLHTDECKEELMGWIAAKLGPAVCKVRQAACKNATTIIA